MSRNYFHITFTVERQPHHWDTAGQPIYCQGCTAKQGTKGTESPAGMWNGLDSTSLIMARVSVLVSGYSHSSKEVLKTLAKGRCLRWYKSPNVWQDP